MPVCTGPEDRGALCNLTVASTRQELRALMRNTQLAQTRRCVQSPTLPLDSLLSPKNLPLCFIPPKVCVL